MKQAERDVALVLLHKQVLGELLKGGQTEPPSPFMVSALDRLDTAVVFKTPTSKGALRFTTAGDFEIFDGYRWARIPIEDFDDA